MKKTGRRYTQDHLLYESFYVSIVNSLIVALGPLGIFAFLAAVENFPMTDGLLESVLRLAQMIFTLSFFINFFYYIYFIRLSKAVAFSVMLLISCVIGFALFFSEWKDLIDNEYNAVIIGAWFLLLGMILIGSKTGWLGLRDREEARYERESWLYRHELAIHGAEEEIPALAEDYTHRYIDHHDEDAEDAEDAGLMPIDPEQDPKRASRPLL